MSEPAFDLKIDLDRLDQNAMEQVEMMGRATRLQARLKRDHAQAKLEQELVEARLKRAIRTNPEKYGVPNGKTTEGSIGEATVQQPEYAAAAKKVIDVKYQLDLIDGVVSALEHRKRMIETEVTLWQHSYYARPHVIAGSMPSGSGARETIETAHKRSIRSKGKPVD